MPIGIDPKEHQHIFWTFEPDRTFMYGRTIRIIHQTTYITNVFQ